LAEASEIAGLHCTKRSRIAQAISMIWNLATPRRPKIYGKDPETLVIQTAISRPRDLGLGFMTWSLAKIDTHG